MKTIKLIILTFVLCSLQFGVCEAQWGQVNNTGYGYLASSGNNIYGVNYYGQSINLSTNNGTSWTQIYYASNYVFSLAASGSNVYVGTYNGVFMSTDNGTSWTPTTLNNHPVNSLAVNGNNIFAGTNLNFGVYLSTDNGTTWNQTSLNNQSINALAINGNYIFAGVAYPTAGVYLSTDNGTTWNQTSNNRQILSLAVNGNNIFAGTASDYGVYLSTDNGTTWNQTSLNNRTVGRYCLAVNGINIFASTGTTGVYVSSDNGTSWIQRNEGFPSGYSTAGLCILNNNIFTATGGFYSRTLNELTGIRPISGELPTHYSLEQNYPNPFNPRTNVKFQMPNEAFVKLIVFDVLGREAATLVNEQLKAGTYEVNWDASNYPSGVYFYKLVVGNSLTGSKLGFVETKKMILVK